MKMSVLVLGKLGMAAAVASGSLLAAQAGVAFADGNPDIPLTLTSPPVTTGGGGGIHPNLTAGDTYTCGNPNTASGNYGAAYLRNQPWGYVIGNCTPGVSFDYSRHDTAGDQLDGYTYGNVDGCGWTNGTMSYLNTGISNTCSTSKSVTTFMSAWDGAGGQTGGGYPVGTKSGASCQEFQNAQPWNTTSGANGTDATGRFIGGAGQTTSVNWRYVSKDGNWVMVDDLAANAAGHPDWVFVAKGCLASTLPNSTTDVSAAAIS
jgi:hypothetical protein